MPRASTPRQTDNQERLNVTTLTDCLLHTNDDFNDSYDEIHGHDSATSSHDFVTVNDLIHHLASKMRALENDNARLRIELQREHHRAHAHETAPEISRPLYEYDK